MHTKTLTLIIAALAVGTGYAQDRPAEPKQAPGPLSPEEMEAIVESVLPSPGEILEASSGVTEIDWPRIVSELAAQPGAFSADYPLDEQKALNLGVQVANAIAALHAEDGESFVKAAAAVEKLAYELSADETLAATSQRIQTLVEQGEWAEARRELEGMRGDVIEKLNSHGDQESVALANVGGWLQGIRLVSAHVAANYSEDSGRLLRQGDLVADLLARIESAHGQTGQSALLEQIREGLSALEAITRTETTEPVSAENAVKIAETSAQLVASIQG